MDSSRALLACIALLWCACSDGFEHRAGETGLRTAEPERVRLGRNIGLALELLQGLPRESDNLACSPYGVAEVLRMLAEGAAGETKRELLAVLGPMSEVEGRREFTIPSQVRLSTSNALWTGKNFPVKDQYKKTLRADYAATVQNVDFETPDAERQIHSWGEQATERRIAPIVPPGSFDAFTVVVVANAVYFRGLWASPFAADATRPASFHTSHGETLSVAMMSAVDTFGYSESGAFQAIQLPYAGGDIVAILVLPGPERDVSEVVTNDLTEATFQQLLSLERTQVRVLLPRFEIESNGDLEDYCIVQGARTPFDGTLAEFPGISAEGTFISQFHQRAVLECDESGTEGAAVTEALIALGYVGEEPPVPEFRADRPFAFFVVHQPSQCVLFAAIVERPEIMER